MGVILSNLVNRECEWQSAGKLCKGRIMALYVSSFNGRDRLYAVAREAGTGELHDLPLHVLNVPNLTMGSMA